MMEIMSGVSRFRFAVERLLFRFISGRYSRKAGIGIGILGAMLIAVAGFLASPAAGHIVSDFSVVPPLEFTTGDLSVLWGVHATVITLSLVALSFAWNSVRTLPTTNTIISEVAYRLRSIETISFLLTANLCIGAGVLLATGDVITADIGLPVGALLIVSIGVTVHRFWIVFDLLLHNTLDEKVLDFADAALSGKSRATANEYDVYLGHFFDACRTEIEHDRPERLREKLRGIEQLLDHLLSSNSPLQDDSLFWDYVFGKYDAVYRRAVTQQNPELEKQVIASLSGVYWKTQNHDDTDLVVRTMQCFETLFARGYSTEPKSSSTQFLLKRFENTQIRVLRKFKDADGAESVEEAGAMVEGLLETHIRLWRTAVEQEAVGAVDYLRHMLDDAHQFREYTYAPPRAVRDAQDAPNDSLAVRKQDRADTYREAINHLKFAAYGWALNLFEEEDVSESFIDQMFSEYVDNDFGSVNTLSEQYLKMEEATEPLNYWERWNIDRELGNSYGVASAGLAINTWLLRFYCTVLVWILDDQDAIDDLVTCDPSESPLTEYDHVQHRVDKIIDQIDSYRDGYPLAEFADSGPPIDKRCDALIDHFEEVKSLLNEQEQDRIRTLPISNDSVDRYGENVDTQLNSCALRTAVEEISGISQARTLDRDTNAEFELYTSTSRRGFVDDGIQTFFNGNFSDLIERYRGLVLEHFNFEERELDAATDVPDELAEVVSHEDVALIVAEHMDVSRMLQDDGRSERSPNSDLGSDFTFTGVPVLRDATTEYAAVVFFDEEFEYVEKVHNYPIDVDVTPGEDVADWNPDELSDEEDIRDYVRIQLSYMAHIDAPTPQGVILRISE